MYSYLVYNTIRVYVCRSIEGYMYCEFILIIGKNYIMTIRGSDRKSYLFGDC